MQCQCPCGTPNSYSDNQLTPPTCTKCQQSLPWIVEVTDLNVGQHLRVPKAFILDFYADWCAPCRSLAPILDSIAKDFPGKVRILKAKVDHNREIQKLYQANSLPTLLIGKGGDTIESPQLVVGLQPKPHLVPIVKSMID